MHLPMHGLLRNERSSAIVVTPSCDLSNRKVSSITYLPVVPFVDWVSCADFMPEVVNSVSSLVEQLIPLGVSVSSTPGRYGLPEEEISSQISNLQRKMKTEKMSKPVLLACQRYVSGCRHIRRVIRGEKADLQDVEGCLTKKRWQQVREHVIRNSFRSDIYFLPADGNEPELSPLANHSVVLFRYPLTVPVAVLDSAQDTSVSDWSEAVKSLAAHEPMALAFSAVRPLKCLRLIDRFLSDLLTKFVGLYSRLGSPDFSRESVETISKELGGSA